ncbi:MAG: hypothetical protein WCL38_03865 [Actinomycetota bacterium]
MTSTMHEVAVPTFSNGDSPPIEVPRTPSGTADHHHREIHPTRRMAEVALVVVLAVSGALLVGVATSAKSTVNSQLVTQGLHFPAASPVFSSTLFPEAYTHAGDLVSTGPLADVYANGYLAPGISYLTGGKTAAEISALTQANTTNATLQDQAAQVFEASTTKGLLLTSSAWSRLAGQLFIGGIALLIGAVLMLGVTVVDVMTRQRRTRNSGSTKS